MLMRARLRQYGTDDDGGGGDDGKMMTMMVLVMTNILIQMTMIVIMLTKTAFIQLITYDVLNNNYLSSNVDGDDGDGDDDDNYDYDDDCRIGDGSMLGPVARKRVKVKQWLGSFI